MRRLRRLGTSERIPREGKERFDSAPLSSVAFPCTTNHTETDMSDLIAGYHREAAEQHKHAAAYHIKAAEEYEKTDKEGFDEDVAASRAHCAHGHAMHALEMTEDAVQEHTEHYGYNGTD